MAVSEDQIKAFMDKHFEDFMANQMRIEPPFKLVSEYMLPNGQAVDKVIIGTNKKILALIECKGEVNLTDFVRGTGQAIQGAYQIAKNQNNDFSENAKSFLVVPIEMAKNVQLDLFDFHNFELIFADIKKNVTIKYSEKDYATTKTNEWVTINPYYFRDCSLYGVYFMLKLLLKNSGEKTITNLGDDIRKVKNIEGVEFFGDIKNNGITLSNLGFYDQATRTLTTRGYEFSKKSFPEFCKELILKDFGEYSRAVFLAILSLSKSNNNKVPTKDIADFIKTLYEGKKVTYLFDPDGQNRDLLTIIRMLEIIGAIERKPKDEIKINYFPLEGMPFQMEHYNKEYSKKLKFWFDRFKIAL